MADKTSQPDKPAPAASSPRRPAWRSPKVLVAALAVVVAVAAG